MEAAMTAAELIRTEFGQTNIAVRKYLHAVPGFVQCFGSERNRQIGTDKNYHLSFPEWFCDER